jgi:hypothetical protein
VGLARDEPLGFESVDGVGDRGRLHLQAAADLAERKDAAPAEQREHQHFVAGKGELERAQDGADTGEEQLVDAHDRRDDRHAGSGVVPDVRHPLPPRLGDRIEPQLGVRHRPDGSRKPAYRGGMRSFDVEALL